MSNVQGGGNTKLHLGSPWTGAPPTLPGAKMIQQVGLAQL